MLCSKLLRGHEAKHGWLYRFTDRGFQALLTAYAWSLRGVSAASPADAGCLLRRDRSHRSIFYTLVPKGFIPNGDNDQMQINVQMQQGTSFYKAVELQAKVADVVRQDPEVETFMTNAGNGNNARFFTMLKVPRTSTAQQIAERLRPKFARIPGVNVVTQIQPPIRIGGGGNNSRSNNDLTLQGPDTEELYESARAFQDVLAEVPEVQDVNSDLEFRSPQIKVTIDRERAALYGLSPSDISNALLRSLRPAQRLHDLLRQDAIPRRHGSAEEVSGLFGLSLEDLLQDQQWSCSCRWTPWPRSPKPWVRRASPTPDSCLLSPSPLT